MNFFFPMQMNPVPVMKLVEIIPGLATSDATLKTTLWEKQPLKYVTQKYNKQERRMKRTREEETSD
jgi:hypothetical protein